MTDKIIDVEHLTKNYKNNKGIFDVSFSVNEGEVFGYLGPNGAGKSTTIRHLMGFIKPVKGKAKIHNLDCWKGSTKIQKKLGYLPGELALPENQTGISYIKYIYKLRKLNNWDEIERMIKYWEFDPTVKIKKMSKGMKQKVGLILTFMHHPDVIILDEPTSGLDPLMQDKFVQLIKSEKAKGHTVLMSSHIFQEIENTCDRVAIIKQGKIISQLDLNEINSGKTREYTVKFDQPFTPKPKTYKIKTIDEAKTTVTFTVARTYVGKFLRAIEKYEVISFEENKFDLEKYFLHFYKQEESKKGKKHHE